MTKKMIFVISLLQKLLGKLVINWQPISYQPFMRKTSLERKHKRTHTHQSHTYTNNLRDSAICLRSQGVIRSSSLLLRNIEYNGINLNRSSLISQTQALQSLVHPTQLSLSNT